MTQKQHSIVAEFVVPVIALVTVCSIAQSALATTLHDAPNFGNSGSNISGLVLTDDFQVTMSISPTDASVWLIELDNLLPGIMEGFSGTLGWAIYPSSGIFPGGTPLATGSDTSPVMTDVADLPGGFDVFRAGIDLEGSLESGTLALAPGTYWFALHEGSYFSPEDGSDIWWANSLDAISGTRPRVEFNETAPGSAWLDRGVDIDYAFRLEAVPEPTSLALAASGLIGWIAIASRRRRDFLN